MATSGGRPGYDRARGRYADKMRKRGTPLMVTPEEFAGVVRLLEKAHAYGMSDKMIARQTGVHASFASKVRNGTIRSARRTTVEKLAALRPEVPEAFFTPARGRVPVGSPVDPTGTVRRVQALRADGFPGRVIGEPLGITYEAVGQLARISRKSVLAATRDAVAALYDSLDGKTPADFGVREYAIGKCVAAARRAGYAPRWCWDKGTIDDPDAVPQWTGYCGTWYGRRVHARDGIPLCPACQAVPPAHGYPGFDGARLTALRERAGLSRAELSRLCGVPDRTIDGWEHGRNAPLRENRLERVLSALDATIDEVCEGL